MLTRVNTVKLPGSHCFEVRSFHHCPVSTDQKGGIKRYFHTYSIEKEGGIEWMAVDPHMRKME